MKHTKQSEFQRVLTYHGIALTKANTATLQVNIGRICDLSCSHCHIEGSPARNEMMSADTVEDVIASARRFNFTGIDITGGAPEFLPYLPRLITGLAPLTPVLIVRTNLVALSRPESAHLIDLYRSHRVTIIASFQSLDISQTDARRGQGVWNASIAMLQLLNSIGYGVEGSGLLLDLATNPVGHFLPESEAKVEKQFRQELKQNHDIHFNRLFTFANVPLGRFRLSLEKSGTLDYYLSTLKKNFNPCTLESLMCRFQITVNWDGLIYDCDFNLAAGLHHGSHAIHISRLQQLPAVETPVPVGDHCFACAAGAGFT